MCFFIHINHKEKKIANRDIVCYKCLFDNFRSPYKYKLYKLNKLSRSFITVTNLFGDPIITRGLHSYSCKRFAISKMGPFHIILVKSIIPKGSEYYYNPDNHEYVSNQIILQEIIKKQ